MKKYKDFEEKDAEICALSLDIIYKEIGLQQAIQYLYNILNNYFPITRVFCGFRIINRPVFYPIADTLPQTLEQTKFTHGSYNTPAEKELFPPKDTLEPYFGKTSPEAEVFTAGIGRLKDYTSHLRIPLFIQGERIFQIALCSDTANIFTEKDLQLAKILAKNLSASLLLQQQKVDNIEFDNSISTENATDLLDMSRGLNSLANNVKKLASTDYTALIEGETGSGKDIIAQNIHELSMRKNKPFIKVNCGAISENLLESELFGYEKGAFTGANTSRKGFFEAAEGGSIFLDEIGELPLKLQTSLLRVIENKCIQKVGSNQEIPVNIRIIAATNKDLEKQSDEGYFRKDLWYRLNIYPLKVPPLRLHREDIPTLVAYFLQKSCLYLGITNIPTVSKEELNKLYDHSWPGNIRELKNTVERAIIHAREGLFCQPLIFNIDYKENLQKLSTSKDTENLVSLEEYNTKYVKYILKYTNGKITGKDGAASILKLHPNTVRQYKNKIENEDERI